MLSPTHLRLNPAWSQYPLRTAFRVFGTYVRRLHPALSLPVVPFDGGRSRVVAELRTSLGLGIYRYGYDDADLHMLGRVLAPGDSFVDGGANVGLFSLVAAARVGETGRVLAFEPAVSTRERLRRNLAVNAYDWIEVREEALGERKGRSPFIEFSGNHSGVSSLVPESSTGGISCEVKVCSLDEVIEPEARARLRLIKLDLEGAEMKALHGCRELLASAAPDLLIEIERAHLARQGSSPEELWAFLESYGYEAYRVHAEKLEPARTVDSRSASPNFYFSCDPARLRGRGIVVAGLRGSA